MVSDQQNPGPAKDFEPLKLMGLFWLVFGVIVLGATFFVKGTPQVPLVRGVFTNIIAGLLLAGTGVFCLVRTHLKQKKQQTGAQQPVTGSQLKEGSI